MALDTHSLVQSLLNKNRQPAAPATPVAAPVEEKAAVIEKTIEEPSSQPVANGQEDLEDAPQNQVSDPETEADDETPEVLYPELKAKVEAAEELLNNGLLPIPQTAEASEDQKEEAADLIQAYFELTDPTDRDHVIILLAANPSQDATDFFLTALSEDTDSYVHSQAAEALYNRGVAAGKEALLEALEGPEDIDQLNHAITVLCAKEGVKIAPKLINIWQDYFRDSQEHIEALMGLEQLMGRGIEGMLLGFIDEIDDPSHIPEDELLQALNVLSRLDSNKCISHLESLIKRLKQNVDDVEDILPLIEAIDGTIALLS